MAESRQLARETPLNADELRPLLAPSAWHSVSSLLLDWGLIAAAIAGAELWWNPLSYALAALLIGARQHGLLVLMHEAAHCGFFRRRRLNDALGELLCAWPFFINMAAYRHNHLAHHRFLNGEQDPDWMRLHDPSNPESPQWDFPRPRRAIIGMLLKDLLGLNTLQLLSRLVLFGGGQGSAFQVSRRQRAAQLAFYLVVAALLTLTGGWTLFALYWVLPLLTVLKALLRLRLIAEHSGVGGQDGTRTVIPAVWERLLLAPHHISYHDEHHRYPGVRAPQLRELHRLRVRRGAFSDPGSCITRGYWRALGECAEGQAAP